MIQEQFYNGWTHDHYVMSVLCFCPDGMIPIAAFNMPGSFHDSTVAEYGGVYAKLEAMFNKYGVKCTANSAFGGKTYPFLIKSSQDPFTEFASFGDYGYMSIVKSSPKLADLRVFQKSLGEKVH